MDGTVTDGNAVMVLRNVAMIPYEWLKSMQCWTLGAHSLSMHGADARAFPLASLSNLLKQMLAADATPDSGKTLAINEPHEFDDVIAWLRQVRVHRKVTS